MVKSFAAHSLNEAVALRAQYDLTPYGGGTDLMIEAKENAAYLFLHAVPELKNIAIIIKDLVESGMGGQTNVDLRSSFIVMDTSSAREEDLSATTFLATVFIRDEMSKPRAL